MALFSVVKRKANKHSRLNCIGVPRPQREKTLKNHHDLQWKLSVKSSLINAKVFRPFSKRLHRDYSSLFGLCKGNSFKIQMLWETWGWGSGPEGPQKPIFKYSNTHCMHPFLPNTEDNSLFLLLLNIFFNIKYDSFVIQCFSAFDIWIKIFQLLLMKIILLF